MYGIASAGHNLAPAFQTEGNVTPVTLPVKTLPLSFCHP